VFVSPRKEVNVTEAIQINVKSGVCSSVSVAMISMDTVGITKIQRIPFE